MDDLIRVLSADIPVFEQNPAPVRGDKAGQNIEESRFPAVGISNQSNIDCFINRACTFFEI